MANRTTGPQLNNSLNRGNREWFSNLPVQPGPDYSVYFNDFLNTADYAAADWTITTVETGTATEAIAADELNGGLKLTNGTADDDSDSLQLNQENWALGAGKRMWMEVRLKISDATQSDFFVGLNITDTTPLVTSDRVGFQKDDGSTAILAKSEKDSTETSTDSLQVVVADTYVKLGMYWDGMSAVAFFVNRNIVATHTTNNPDNENLAVTVHLQNGEAAAKNATIDYIYVCQER